MEPTKRGMYCPEGSVRSTMLSLSSVVTEQVIPLIGKLLVSTALTPNCSPVELKDETPSRPVVCAETWTLVTLILDVPIAPFLSAMVN